MTSFVNKFFFFFFSFFICYGSFTYARKRTAGVNNERKRLRILTREEFESKGLFTSDEERRMTLNPKFEYTFMNSGYIYMRKINKVK